MEKTDIKMDSYLIEYAMEMVGAQTPEQLVHDALQAYVSQSPKAQADSFGGDMPDIYEKNPQWDAQFNGP